MAAARFTVTCSDHSAGDLQHVSLHLITFFTIALNVEASRLTLAPHHAARSSNELLFRARRLYYIYVNLVYLLLLTIKKNVMTNKQITNKLQTNSIETTDK